MELFNPNTAIQFADKITPPAEVMQVHPDGISTLALWLGATEVARHTIYDPESGLWRDHWTIRKTSDPTEEGHFSVHLSGLRAGDWVLKTQARDSFGDDEWKTYVEHVPNDKFQRDYILKGTNLDD